MPGESDQTALATHALKGLAELFRYSQGQSQAEDDGSKFSPPIGFFWIRFTMPRGQLFQRMIHFGI